MNEAPGTSSSHVKLENCQDWDFGNRINTLCYTIGCQKEVNARRDGRTASIRHWSREPRCFLAQMLISRIEDQSDDDRSAGPINAGSWSLDRGRRDASLRTGRRLALHRPA